MYFLVNYSDGLPVGLLAEYFIAVAFVASGFSANLRGLIAPLGISLPKSLSNPFEVTVVSLISLLLW